MMRLYFLRGDLDFYWLQTLDDAPWPWRGGVPVESSWAEPTLTVSEKKLAETFLPVDCMSMNTGSDGPILSSYARDVLGEMLSPAGQFLPVRVQDHQYWWFNCLSCVSALDPERTDAEWNRIRVNENFYKWISVPRALEFQSEVVALAPNLFRIPEFPQGVLFGTEKLNYAIRRYKLTGFRMDTVWSSVEGGVRNPSGFDFSEAFTDRAPGEIARKRARVQATLKRRKNEAGAKLQPSEELRDKQGSARSLLPPASQTGSRTTTGATVNPTVRGVPFGRQSPR